MSESLRLEKDEMERLSAAIEKRGLQKIEPKTQYEAFRVKEKGVFLVLYTSGSLVYKKGPIIQDMLDEVMEKKETHDVYMGSDEAGKGEWFGPLVVCCAAVASEDIGWLRKMGVKDSKNISRKRIMYIAERIKERLDYQTEVLTPSEYNLEYRKLSEKGGGLNDLLAKSHESAIKKLWPKLNAKNALLVIDEFDKAKMEVRLKDFQNARLEVIQKTRAESEPIVAAASIIAKSVFEEQVSLLEREYNTRIRGKKPQEIDPEILPRVAKTHFKNVGA